MLGLDFSHWHVAGILVLAVCLLIDRMYFSKKNHDLGLYIVLLVHFIFFNAITHSEGNDYSAYEGGALSLLNGTNMYDGTTRYMLNFPLVAGCIAECYQCLLATMLLRNGEQTSAATLATVFYLFQVLQLVMIGLGYRLSRQLLMALGMNKTRSSIVCALLWLLCSPVYQTVRKGQVNLIALDCCMLSLVYAGSKPVVAGIATAVGTFIKVYPAATIPAALITRRKKLLVGFAVCSAMMVFIQTVMCGSDIWAQFFKAISAYPIADPFLDRELPLEPAVSSGVYALFRLVAASHMDRYVEAVHWLSVLVTFIISCWFAWRIRCRERSYHQLPAFPSSAAKTRSESARFNGHVADLLALALLISPHVWPPHYVMALPTILLSLSGIQPINTFGILGIILILSGNPFGIHTAAYLCITFLKPIGLIVLVGSQPPALAARQLL
jgi:hypothetical protein